MIIHTNRPLPGGIAKLKIANISPSPTGELQNFYQGLSYIL